VSFSLQEFSEVFKIRNKSGQPYVLIGGQAVNFWAERYSKATVALTEFRPFASRDIDFMGDRSDVEHIAGQLQLPPLYPPKVAMTALSGMIPLNIGNAKSSIEVVRHIPGISSEAKMPAVEAEWNGVSILVLDPISLLASKLELAATVLQEDRQDVRHLKILVICARAFIEELLSNVENGHLPARDWLKVVNQVQKLTTTHRALKIAKQHNIAWREIYPAAALAKSSDKKIRRFWENYSKQMTKSVSASQEPD
jgi:hypothetical protein